MLIKIHKIIPQNHQIIQQTIQKNNFHELLVKL